MEELKKKIYKEMKKLNSLAEFDVISEEEFKTGYFTQLTVFARDPYSEAVIIYKGIKEQHSQSVDVKSMFLSNKEIEAIKKL